MSLRKLSREGRLLLVALAKETIVSEAVVFVGGPIGGERRMVEAPVPLIYSVDVPSVPAFSTTVEEYEYCGNQSGGAKVYRWRNPAEALRRENASLRRRVSGVEQMLRQIQDIVRVWHGRG